MKTEVTNALQELDKVDPKIAVIILKEALIFSLTKRDRLFTGMDRWTPAKDGLDDDFIVQILNSHRSLSRSEAMDGN